MSPGAFHNQSQGMHPDYSQHHYPTQPTMTPQFSPVSPASQHSWQGQQQSQQPPPAYPPPYQVSEMQGSIDGHQSVSPVGQPQWQLGPQPAIPHATKPTVNHPQQQEPSHPAPNASQPQFHNPAVAQQQHPQLPNQLPNQFPGNPYQQGHPIYEAPGDVQQVGRPPSQTHPDPQQQQQMAAGMYYQNPQHGSQHGTPFSGGIPPPSAVPSNFANNSSMTSLNAASNMNPQQGNLSHHPSMTSLSSSNHPSTNNRPANSFIAELPDNQVGISQTIPNQHPVTNQPPPNGMVTELPGSEPIRHTPTDPQFVSGPWTSPPPGGGANQYPTQNRYNNNNPGGFSR